jgi:hypothetical protein
MDVAKPRRAGSRLDLSDPQQGQNMLKILSVSSIAASIVLVHL